MGSSAKKRQTFAKMTRERAVKEKRQLKQEKKEAKKQARLIEEAGGSPFAPELAEGETRSDETADPVTPRLEGP